MGATIWRHSNSVDESLSLGGNTFTSQPGITRGEISDGREPLVVKLPSSHAFPQMYRSISPATPVSWLQQFLDRDDNPDSLRVIYKGWVKSVKFVDDGTLAELYLESVISGFDEVLCDDTYCVGCQVPLFGTKCGLNRNDWKYEGTVSLVNGNQITVDGLWGGARGASWAVPGSVKFGDDWRQVHAQSGDVLTLPIPFYEDVDGETVTVYAGCDHTITACEEIFNNVVNYRGYPWVPTENVFMTGLQG